LPFTALSLHPSLLRAIKELGFVRPTPVQADAIPPALKGRDVLACAQTGSGKTAAFLLPVLQGLIGKPRGTTRALVLAPTRELAAQILDDLQALAVHTPVTGAAVFGGVRARRSTRSAAASTSSSPRPDGCSITFGTRTPS
jgi:ATP-dependent RNA helicase RhlE